MQLIRQHKLALSVLGITLGLIFVLLVIRNNLRPSPVMEVNYKNVGQQNGSTAGYGYSAGSSEIVSPAAPAIGMPAPDVYEPGTKVATDATKHIQIQESFLSLQVKDVKKTGDEILTYARNNGGFMVNTTYNQPEQAPFGTISVRVPSERLQDALKHFRSLGVKVVNENITGEDVTDQFLDIEKRLETLALTENKYKELLNRSASVTDIANLQRELLSLQQQMDSLKGQQQALERNAKLTKVTVYLSTDELALPYTPDKSLRPSVVFKQAIRSLLGTLRGVAEIAIWLGVYSVIWLPIAIAIWILARRKKTSKN